MLLIRIDPKKPDAAAFKKAVAVLKAGGLVVYPTETAYALSCAPASAAAVRRLFAVKGRDGSKPLPLIAATAAMAKRAVKLDRYGTALAEAFWPGPLTLVAPAKKGTLAVRVSSHPTAAALAKAFGGPVVSTSANRSGGPAAFDVPSVLKQLGARPDLVLDAGPLKPGPVSTIVRPLDGVIEILREGAVSEEEIHRALMKTL